MPTIRGSLDAGQPLVQVLIRSALEPGRFQECTALIDTGCSITGITRTIVETLDLRHTTRRLVATPLGEARRRAYPFTVGFLAESMTGVGSVRSPYNFPEPVLGVDFVENSGFDVLLGMDILSKGRLLFEHGQFEFSF